MCVIQFTTEIIVDDQNINDTIFSIIHPQCSVSFGSGSGSSERVDQQTKVTNISNQRGKILRKHRKTFMVVCLFQCKMLCCVVCCVCMFVYAACVLI